MLWFVWLQFRKAPRELDLNAWVDSLSAVDQHFSARKSAADSRGFLTTPKQCICSLLVFVLRVLKFLCRNSIFFEQLCVQTTVYWTWVWSLYSAKRHSAATEVLIRIDHWADIWMNQCVTWDCFTGTNISQRLLSCNSLVFLEDGWYPVSSHLNLCFPCSPMFEGLHVVYHNRIW